uniref:Reverse transcriptase domain-containing protein n=1 Tax=Oryzias sinensis TaxID=183150 RepID=A0A8C7WYP2_9TELE
MWLKQSYYDQGEKCGKLLAWRIRKQQSDRAINSIKTSGGDISTNPAEINNTFRSFYELLYTSECSNNWQNQNSFLNKLKFQTLSKNQQQELECNLISEAIQNMQSGKAPGPDGFPIEFYKKFGEKLLAPLLAMYEESYTKDILPPSLRLASITLILKPNKPPNECSSFRPISLMGSDIKILCKVLARRLESHLTDIINNDQNGFIKNRYGFHNVRRLLNIMHSKKNSKDAAILSLDARQAFDRIEWGFLFNVLPRYGIGENFLKWIRLLYTDPTAEILTNNNISKPFTLQRSTRQGCPLSPLLFVLAIEPLAMAIRSHNKITGVKICETEHRIALYADDIILFLTNLKDSIPQLINLIESFGIISGYKINNAKSALMLLDKNERTNPTLDSPFAMANEGFTYLGIKICPDLTHLISLNYDPLVDKVREMLNRWTQMPISMIGRINIIKMVVLPKFLYLFQALPLPLPDTFFQCINNLFNQFIWNYKKARLKTKLLCLPYKKGGLQLPDLKLYYWSAQLRLTMYYFSGLPHPSWVTIEQNTTSELPLNLYLYSASPTKLIRQTKNPFLKNSIKIWNLSHKYVGDTQVLSQFSPIWGNNNFLPGRADGGFKIWFTKGIKKISDLYTSNNLMSFGQLCEKYNVSRKHFFKFLQLKHFIYSTQKQLSLPPLSKMEELIKSCIEGKGQISLFYNLLLTHSKESSLQKLEAWKIDISEDISEVEWEMACLKAQTQSVNTKFKLLQYKWLMRTYLTPSRLNHIFPDIPDICVKCKVDKGTLIHCLWECPMIQCFWKSVTGYIGHIIGNNVPLCSRLCVLGIYPQHFVVTQKQ